MYHVSPKPFQQPLDSHGATTMGTLTSFPPKPQLGRPPKTNLTTSTTEPTNERRPLGRPRGSGHRQRARAEQLARGEILDAPTKRPVGRPKKIKQPAERDSGRVTVKQIEGKIVSDYIVNMKVNLTNDF